MNIRISPLEHQIVRHARAAGWAITRDGGRVRLTSPRGAVIAFGIDQSADPAGRPYELVLDEFERTGK